MARCVTQANDMATTTNNWTTTGTTVSERHNAAYWTTTLQKSSCASVDPSNTETATARDDAIADLPRMKDRLQGMLTHYEGTLKCATAWV